MCTRGDGKPGGHAEALAMVASGLDYLSAAAADGELAEPVLGEVLLGLESAAARQAAARSQVLSRFDAGDCHDSDGCRNSSAWLRDRAGMTLPAARRQVRQMRALRDRPRLAAALGAGQLGESYLDKVLAWTRPVPGDMLDFADQVILQVLATGGTLEEVRQVIAALLESGHAQEQREQDPDPSDEAFGDRSLRLETTIGGAGVLHASLTPAAAAALQAILESLGKRNGPEDTRTQAQRDHDAFEDACGRLLASRTLPDRAGSDTRAEVRIDFRDLVSMPGADTLTEAWLRGKVGEPGWLLGKDAEAAMCDALISPVVTATPDWGVITEMIELVLDAHGARRASVWDPVGCEGAPGWPSVPSPGGERQDLLEALGRLAIKFVSGPGAIASLLRTGILPAPFSTKSMPLDIGFSHRIPDSIRRAVIARAGGRCE